MRHRVAGTKLNMPSDQRLALLHGLVRSLILHERIETTETRAKEARVIAEKLITLSKKDNLNSRRLARKILTRPHAPKAMLHAKSKEQKAMREKLKDQDPVKRLFDVVAPKFADKQSGYTRIIKIGFRKGDAASVVKLELAVD